jgi:hypothetical protein
VWNFSTLLTLEFQFLPYSLSLQSIQPPCGKLNHSGGFVLRRTTSGDGEGPVLLFPIVSGFVGAKELAVQSDLHGVPYQGDLDELPRSFKSSSTNAFPVFAVVSALAQKHSIWRKS